MLIEIRRLRGPAGILLLCTASLLLTACASDFVTVYPDPPQEFEKLGPATGKATGSLGILSAALYFVPLGLNSRVDRAYARAVESVPGATGLINVEMRETWLWWLIGTARTVTITGEAIREKK